MIKIEITTIDSIPAIRELAVTVYADTFGAHYTSEDLDALFKDSFGTEQFRNEFYEPGAQLFIALDDLKIIGFLRLRKNKDADKYMDATHIELHQLYIHHDYHGSDVSKMIMEAALAFARSESYVWMWLSVWENNVRAQNYYTKCGFERFSEYTYFAGNDRQVDWLMRKKL